MGDSLGSVISNSYTTAPSVAGEGYVGGLIGRVLPANDDIGNSYSNDIGNSYASTGPVTGERGVGGLIGYNDGSISDSYSTGAVEGNNFIRWFGWLQLERY